MSQALGKLAAQAKRHRDLVITRTGEIRCECLVDELKSEQAQDLTPESLAAYKRAAHQCRRDLGECHAAMQSGDRENLRRSLSSFVSNSTGIGAALLP